MTGTANTVVEVHGHIIDSLILAKILDVIVESGAQYRMLDLQVGNGHEDPSSARIELTAQDDDLLEALLLELHPHGAQRLHEPDATLVACDRDGVLPEGFYATTNLPTRVKVDGRWLEVERPEMDCALVVDAGASRAWIQPMHRVKTGDLVVVGAAGVAVQPLEKPRGPNPFEFMGSDVSSEKPKGLLVAEVADRIRASRFAGGKLLAVCGPAVIHTGAGPDLARLVSGGWVDVLFAGNGFAVHDIESSILGTSLGVSVSLGHPTEGGHANHLRVINEVRRWGSIAAGVGEGRLTSGVMYECVSHGVPFVLAGSVRDDGPLPNVITDMVAAQDAMREQLDGVRVALMLASTLHGIATGNILPATVETYCVDINQAVVTKLADRGSHQVLGIVTDAGLFLRQLVETLPA
ncbi:MAG TPA: TIGR00300 family protein [Actinomycetota bacterium]|nr:TIGR00300 family protein [Actinomycetota bacterium]